MDNSTSPVSSTKEKAPHWIHRKRKLIFCIIAGGLLVVLIPTFSAIQSQNEIQFTLIDCGKGAPISINNHGQVVGYSGIHPGEISHAFIWDKQQGKQDLGSLGGGSSQAACINDRGQVVGQSLTSNNSLHAFLWTKEQGMQDLGTLGGDNSFATSINDKGQITGYADTKGGESRPFLWTEEKGMQALEGGRGEPTSINNAGQIVGGDSQFTNAFIWIKEKGALSLGDSDSLKSGRANSINNKGQIVGRAFTRTNNVHRAFLWTEENGMQDLGTLEGTGGASANSINEQGDIVGYSTTRNGKIHAFLWTKEKGMQDLGKIGSLGELDSAATSINDHGQIVGSILNKPPPWWVEAWDWLGEKFYLPNNYRPVRSDYGGIQAVLWTIPPSSEKSSD